MGGEREWVTGLPRTANRTGLRRRRRARLRADARGGYLAAAAEDREHERREEDEPRAQDLVHVEDERSHVTDHARFIVIAREVDDEAHQRVERDVGPEEPSVEARAAIERQHPDEEEKARTGEIEL